MADSNVPSTPEEQNALVGNTPNAELLLNKEQVIMANSNAPISQENKQVDMIHKNEFTSLESQKIIGRAISDMEYKVELFNTLTHTCFCKCIDTRFKEGELHLGEASCVDRCVAKYNQVNNMIGQMLASGKYRM